MTFHNSPRNVILLILFILGLLSAYRLSVSGDNLDVTSLSGHYSAIGRYRIDVPEKDISLSGDSIFNIQTSQSMTLGAFAAGKRILLLGWKDNCPRCATHLKNMDILALQTLPNVVLMPVASSIAKKNEVLNFYHQNNVTQLSKTIAISDELFSKINPKLDYPILALIDEKGSLIGTIHNPKWRDKGFLEVIQKMNKEPE